MTMLLSTCLAAMMILTVATCYVIHLEADINAAAEALRNHHLARAMDDKFTSPPSTVTITIINPSSTSPTKVLPTLLGTDPSQGEVGQVDYAPCLHLYEPCTPSRTHCCTGSCQVYTKYEAIGNFTVCMK